MEALHFTFCNELFAEDVQLKDNKYSAIHKRIQKYWEYFAAENMNDLLDLKGREKGVLNISKYVKVNEHGQLPLLHASSVEQESMKRL